MRNICSKIEVRDFLNRVKKTFLNRKNKAFIHALAKLYFSFLSTKNVIIISVSHKNPQILKCSYFIHIL